MRLQWTAPARRDLRAYLYHLAVENPRAATREANRILDALEHFATLPTDGVAVRIRGYPDPVRRWLVHPFHLYYERRPRALVLLRLYHHARKPIERPA